MSPGPGSTAISMKEESADKEKVVEKQRRLSEHRDLLKDKFKNVSERKNAVSTSVLTNKFEVSSNRPSFSETINPKKQLTSIMPAAYNNGVLNSSSASVFKSEERSHLPCSAMTSTSISTRNQMKSQSMSNSNNENFTNKSSKMVEKYEQSVCNSISMPTTSQNNQKNQQPSFLKYSKSNNVTPKKSKSVLKHERNISKRSLRKKSNHSSDSRFFSTSIMDDYLNNTQSKSFSLPKDEYQELMNIKSSITNVESSSNKLLEFEGMGKGSKKCFYQTTPLLEVRDDDGPIIDCHIDRKYLVLVHRDAINVYERKGKKEWSFKNSVVRLRFSDIIKEMIISCCINKSDTLVLCQVHLVKDDNHKKTFIKMTQYCFLEEDKKPMKEYHLGSYDCAMEKLRCCHIAKRPCCIGITGWNVARSRTVGWVFTYSEVNDTMRCGAMIPLKHEVDSLHDISLTPHRNVLLAFGGRVFTIWNAKTGERLSCCSFEKFSPKCRVTCHFGCFATIQKGFLFILANTGDKLHMIATNLDTETSKSLRKFTIPRDHKCIAVGVKDDKLVGITDKSIICWSLKNTLRVQQLRLDSCNNTFLLKNKILITSGNKLKKILTIKSDTDYRTEMASKMKEMMSSDSTENE